MRDTWGIGDFSVNVLKHREWKQLKKGFILSYSSGGIEFIISGKVCSGGVGRKLTAHITSVHRKQREQEVEQGDLSILKAYP